MTSKLKHWIDLPGENPPKLESLTGDTMRPDGRNTLYELSQDVVVAALVVAARLGLPADVQELLLHGEVSRGIPPNILRKMLEVAIGANAMCCDA